MIDIILFAGIAAFIGIRLYNALGRKDFEPDKKPAPVAQPIPEKVIDANYVVIKPAITPEEDSKLEEVYGVKLASEIRKITKLDPYFSAQNFLTGAKKAFEVILRSFSSGDKDTLKPLLSRDVYNAFSDEIDVRAASGNVTDTTLIAIISATIKDITINNKYVRIAVHIVSEQVHLVKDKHGKVIEGNPSQVDKISELWTFGRDTTSISPNWELIETAVVN